MPVRANAPPSSSAATSSKHASPPVRSSRALRLARRIAFYKSVAINLGANIVRRELKLPEVPITAADARFTFAG